MRRRSLLASNLRSILVPKLDVRCVCALWESDVYGIVFPVGFIVFAKPITQSRGLHAHEGIGHGVKRLRTIENRQSDVVALQPLAAPGQSFIDEVLQEPLAAL